MHVHVCVRAGMITALFVFTRFHSLTPHSVAVVVCSNGKSLVKAVNLDSVPCSPSSKLRITHLTLRPSSFPQLSTGVRNKNQFWPLIKVMVMGVMQSPPFPSFYTCKYRTIKIKMNYCGVKSGI